MDRTHVRLMLVDDHRVVRIGLASLFGTVDHFTVVGQAGSVAEAITEANRCLPDVVLLDLRLPDGTGVEACREIRSDHPETRVLMLTSYADDEAVVASIVAGAAGYFLKQSDPDGLVEAVETVARGGSLIDPAVARAVVRSMREYATQGANGALGELGEMEGRVLPLIADGKTNREIASELSLDEETVAACVRTILRLLNVARPGEALPSLGRG
jgi:DNA-binding NarL/FixJ family response regulator